MNFKKILPYISIIGLLLVLSIGLFPDAFQGKVVRQPDMLNFSGMGNEVAEFRKETGEVSVWTNSTFSGMPTFIWGGAPYKGNKLKPIQEWLLTLGMPFPSGRFFTAFLSFFLLTIVLRINPWIGLIGALAFGLSTYNFLISEAGHTSKLLAITYFPVVAAGTILTYRGKYLLGGLIFGIGLGLDIMASHIQMTYYLAICLGILVLVKLYYSIREGKVQEFAKASAVLLLPLILAIGSNASSLWTSYDYMKETIRGPQVLETGAGNNRGGLEKDYVFQWSHGIGESLSFIIPGAYGGGSVEKMDKDFSTYKDLRKKGVNPQALKSLPSYWGAMPFTSGPIYFGAIVWFLFVLGLLIVKGPLKWWLLFSTILITLLSFGKNLMWFNSFFYEHFPLYDKFRSVNSILSVLQLTLPFLGVLALAKITEKDFDKTAALKKLYIALGITGGFVVIAGFLGGAFLDFTGLSDARLKESGYNLAALMEDRQSMLQRDALRSFFYILASGGLLWWYLKGKMNGKIGLNLLFAGIALLMLFDLGGIGKRYLNSDNFTNAKRYENNFKPRPVDQQILTDKDPNYRVFDLSISTFKSNRSSNYHKTIGGYHAAKLRRYQDMIERHIGTGNQKVLDMLNTKYVITQDQKAQRNPGALGNAWLVSNIQFVDTPDQEIGGLSNFEPRQTAIVHKEFQPYLNGFSGGDGQGTITLSNYKPNHLTYSTNTSAEQLAVFSEVIYKPNGINGWKSYLDGKEVDHMRANYVLRAMKVPAGQHTIEFKFYPPSYFTGEKLAMICSLLLIFGGIGYGAWQWKENRIVEQNNK